MNNGRKLLMLFSNKDIEVFKYCESKLKRFSRYCEESEKWLTSKKIGIKKLKKTQNIVIWMNEMLFIKSNKKPKINKTR